MNPNPPLLRRQNLRMRIATLLAAVTLAGCASVTTPLDDFLPLITQFGVYKLDINQGNYLTQDMVEKLRVGQTRTQVRQVLGTPLLTDAFHADRWDYVYQYTRTGKLQEQRGFTVYFVEDKLARWEGDELPASAAQLNRAAADRTLAPEPSADDQGYLGRLLDILKGNW